MGPEQEQKHIVMNISESRFACVMKRSNLALRLGP
jgi:hypothetical protein